MKLQVGDICETVDPKGADWGSPHRVCVIVGTDTGWNGLMDAVVVKFDDGLGWSRNGVDGYWNMPPHGLILKDRDLYETDP